MVIQNIQDKINELRDDNTSGTSEFINKAIEIIKTQLKHITDPHKDIKEDIIYKNK